MPEPSTDKRSATCGCVHACGDDGDIDGPGMCKGLPIVREPMVEMVVVWRDSCALPKELAA